MTTARWFLAHSKSCPVEHIDTWAKALTPALTSPGWDAQVTSARADYELRARAMGGWHRWCQDVPRGVRWDGTPLFHGIIIPEGPIVGRATDSLIRGFLDAGKHVFAWEPSTGRFHAVSGLKELGLDNWKQWSKIVLTSIS